MKRIFALLGACALLVTFSAPAAVHATPTATSAKSMNITWGGATDNITWGGSIVPAGSTIGAAPAGDGVFVVVITPDGDTGAGMITTAEFVAAAPNITWGG